MKAARACSSASSSAGRVTASSVTALYSSAGSRWPIATSSCRSAACWPMSSRPTEPKSISASCPDRRTSTLPGCGSAWKVPWRRIWRSRSRSSPRARAARSAPSLSSSGPASRTVTPSNRSRTSSRRLEMSVCTAGMSTVASGGAAAAITAMLRASIRKSSSSARASAKPRARSPTCQARASSAWDSARRVSRRIISRSRVTCSSIPGRCTLRMTAVPSARQAACACASDALASGSGSTLLKTSPGS